MKAYNDPILLLKEISNAASQNPNQHIQYAENRKARLHRAFYSNFDPLNFSESIESRVAPLLSGETDELPIVAGIPVTDLMAYGVKRMSEMPRQEVTTAMRQVESAMCRLLDVHDVSLMPISIATAELSEGKVHVPTFGEVVFLKSATETMNAVVDSRDFGMHMIAPFERFVTRLTEIDPKQGIRSEPLAIVGLQLAYGHRDTVGFMHDSALAAASMYLLENQLPKLPKSAISNLIDTASNTGVALKELRLSQTLPLKEYFECSDSQELLDKFESECIRSESMQIVARNQDRISHDYNPSQYFDM